MLFEKKKQNVVARIYLIPVKDQDRPVFVARPRSKIKFRHKTEFRWRPPPASIGGIEFDPGSHPRLSLESVITDPPLASRISPPAISAALGAGGGKASLRNGIRKRGESIAPLGGYTVPVNPAACAPPENGPHPVARPRPRCERERRASGSRSGSGDDSDGLLAHPAEQRRRVPNGVRGPHHRALPPASQREFIPQRTATFARDADAATRRETPAAVSVTTSHGCTFRWRGTGVGRW